VINSKVDRFSRALGLERLVGPLDASLAHLAGSEVQDPEIRRLRWFWLDGLFATISVSFYTNYVGLFAMAYGANNAQVGQLTGIASLFGMIALLPGARAIDLFGGRRKSVVIVFGGIIARVALIIWALLPSMVGNPNVAITVIIAVNAVISFANYFANPAWTAMVAEIIPREIRGRLLSHRNLAINLPTLLIVPLAGWLIEAGNRPRAPLAGYQIVFALAFLTGIVSTLAFSKIEEPAAPSESRKVLGTTDLVRAIRGAPQFLPFVACMLIWSLGVQVVAPFLNIYLANDLGASTATIGWVTAASGLSVILTQRWLGLWVDRRGNIWVQGVLSFIIPAIPLAWMAATSAWQLVFVNAIAGVLWAGYGIANFNLLLDLSPSHARAEATALFQLVVLGSATVAPLVGGRLADAFGYPVLFLLSAGLRIAGAIAFLLWVARPALRRGPRIAAQG